MSPVAIPDLIVMEVTSSTSPYYEKKASIWFLQIYTGTPWTGIFVLRVPMYSVWSITDFVVRTFLASCFASRSVARRMSHIALDLQANSFGPILRPLRASSRVSLLTPKFPTLYVSGQQGYYSNIYSFQSLRDDEKIVAMKIFHVFWSLFGIVHHILLS